MSRQITIKQATSADKDFIIETIIEAEKSGTDLLSYSAIFNITEQEFIYLLGQILEEDMIGQELCVSGFLIALVNGKYAAAICSWVEGEEGLSSMLKANALMYFLGKEKFLAAANAIKTIEELNIPREPGAIQLESIYTKKEFRGLGLSKKLIDEHINRHKLRLSAVSKAQIILMQNNLSATITYEKAGFHKYLEKTATTINIEKFLPGNSKLLMEKII